MVSRLVGCSFRARAHELVVEFGNIIADIFSARDKEEEVANHSQRIFTIIQNNNFWAFLTFMIQHTEKSKNYYFEFFSIGRSPSSTLPISASKFSYRPFFGAQSEMSNHLIRKPWAKHCLPLFSNKAKTRRAHRGQNQLSVHGRDAVLIALTKHKCCNAFFYLFTFYL